MYLSILKGRIEITTVSIRRVFSLIIIFAIIQTPFHVRAEEPAFSEYEVKAGFIYNFAKFIEWPSETFPDAKKAITLCLVGTDPFGNALEVLENKTAQNRKLEIKYTGRSKDLKTCNILFISTSERENIPQVLEILKGSATLTIGDTRGYAQQGIMINFIMDQNKIRFEINTESARRAKVIISSKLLKLAKVIHQ